jgi:hypothetical protein
MVNWDSLLSKMDGEVREFVDRKLSGDRLYELAIAKGVGPLVRPLVRRGVERSRKAAREALRRRGMIS